MPPHPLTEPYAEDVLDVGDGQRLSYRLVGDPAGKPAVVLHGGPGSGCTPRWAQYFDPVAYRVVLVDQRGAGRSSPHASEPDADLTVNTTAHLVADLEQVRAHLGIDRWLVLGGSWGSTLGLAYAEEHPDRVTEMVLFAVVTTTRREVDWVTRQMGRVFPEEWRRFRDHVPPADRDGDLADAYARLLADHDPVVRDAAAREWCAWEDRHVQLGAMVPDPRFADPRFRLGFARLVTHYWRHGAFVPEGALLAGAERLGDVPAVLVHGRRDVSSPLETAYDVHLAWPGSELVVVEDVGHGGGSMRDLVVDALDRFARV